MNEILRHCDHLVSYDHFRWFCLCGFFSSTINQEHRNSNHMFSREQVLDFVISLHITYQLPLLHSPALLTSWRCWSVTCANFSNYPNEVHCLKHYWKRATRYLFLLECHNIFIIAKWSKKIFVAYQDILNFLNWYVCPKATSKVCQGKKYGTIQTWSKVGVYACIVFCLIVFNSSITDLVYKIWGS